MARGRMERRIEQRAAAVRRGPRPREERQTDRGEASDGHRVPGTGPDGRTCHVAALSGGIVVEPTPPRNRWRLREGSHARWVACRAGGRWHRRVWSDCWACCRGDRRGVQELGGPPAPGDARGRGGQFLPSRFAASGGVVFRAWRAPWTWVRSGGIWGRENGYSMERWRPAEGGGDRPLDRAWSRSQPQAGTCRAQRRGH